jgi:rhodanese-related sulfurtransferase
MSSEDADPQATSPTLDAHLEELRSQYERLGPEAAAAEIERGAILVDIRPHAQRVTEGEVPGALIVERNVLEWRFAPSSDHRLPDVDPTRDTVIIMCSAGYASSLAAVSLRTVGVTGATDLDGGFQAWAAAGLPTAPART